MRALNAPLPPPNLSGLVECNAIGRVIPLSHPAKTAGDLTLPFLTREDSMVKCIPIYRASIGITSKHTLRKGGLSSVGGSIH